MLTVFDMATGHILEQSPAKQAKARAHTRTVPARKNHPQADLALQTIAEGTDHKGEAHVLAEGCLKELLRDTE